MSARLMAASVGQGGVKHPLAYWAAAWPATRRNLHTAIIRLKVVHAIPVDISIISWDILNNLRAALDHLAWQLVEENGCAPSVQTSFPIFKSADEYEAGRARKVQGMSQAAVDLIDAAKPYQGGNDALWLIHDLNRIDKHRLLLPMATYNNSIIIGMRRRTVELPSTVFQPFKDGAKIATISMAARAGGLAMQMDHDPQFTFQIAFGEPEVLKGESLAPTFQQYAHLVDSIVAQFLLSCRPTILDASELYVQAAAYLCSRSKMCKANWY